jgi:hypothetical protein
VFPRCPLCTFAEVGFAEYPPKRGDLDYMNNLEGGGLIRLAL